MPARADALAGRAQAMPITNRHYVNGRALLPPYPQGVKEIVFGMGCFWGAERMFWGLDGVYVTAVGYAGGYTPNPSYREVCSGFTGHNEVVRVVYDPQIIAFSALLRVFWEGHDPTQGMRQGNDVGTQYRSGIYYYDEAQHAEAEQSRGIYQGALHAAGHGDITTEIVRATEFYYAEDVHQQYLAKNPGGYCGHGGIGISCSVGPARG
ncbi:MAG: peptide-methionine (S)-S-oxide reductase MsrA [Chromatiales bacterium]|jgi:peptide-methionine (S)-S-oxide reductase|nr:peptide-methionine (S)-S-oxide reductase MsrA [Chromatiales bacterium]